METKHEICDERRHSHSGAFGRWCKGKWEKIESDALHIGQITKQLVKDDPRKIIHSVKVGLAIALVSLFYYFDPLYQGFGVNAMWAVLTVVLVFEFSVGATIGRGVNRVLATIVGGMLAVGAHRLSSLSGATFEPILLGSFVFLIAAVATFIRFFPEVNARYDYGLMILILTFSLICVSGYRDDQVTDMAIRRIGTILIGTLVAVIVCIGICPIWAGTDLHKLVTSQMDTLADFILELGDEFFKSVADDDATNEQKTESLHGFKRILDSKSKMDSLVNFAKWEPRHGKFRNWHPWDVYHKVGELTCHCARIADALRNYLHSHVEEASEVKNKMGEPCRKISIHAGTCLKRLSEAMRKMREPTEANSHIGDAKQAMQLLRSSTLWNYHTSNNIHVSDVTPTATVAFLLSDILTCTNQIVDAVQELASQAGFKNIHHKQKNNVVEVFPTLEAQET